MQVVEFGGYFFVRDGHHRVSVAKAHHIDFLDAEVVRFAVPVRLLPRMTMAKLPLLEAKLEFHDETGVFDVVAAEDVGDAHPDSWQFLRGQVRTGFPRLLGMEGPLPDTGAIPSRWSDGPHRIIRDYMRREVALLLFPGRDELDVICEVLRRWQRVGQETSLVAAYRDTIRVARRRRPFAAVAQRLRRALRRTAATAA